MDANPKQFFQYRIYENLKEPIPIPYNSYKLKGALPSMPTIHGNQQHMEASSPTTSSSPNFLSTNHGSHRDQPYLIPYNLMEAMASTPNQCMEAQDAWRPIQSKFTQQPMGSIRLLQSNLNHFSLWKA